MKTILHTSCLAILLGMGISGNGNAAIITDPSANGYYLTDVGSADTLLTQLADPSGGLGDADLTTWINNYFGNPDPAITYITRTEDFTGYYTSDPALAAYKLVDQSEYFILHNAHDIALFGNVASLDWAVFDWTALSADFNIKEAGTKISFIAEFNGNADFCTTHPGDPSCGDVPMPEPGMLALIGLGMLSMFVPFRRSITI
ncbi:MAG: PEP-CTERM sorting domain-containing protein [Methylomonas sp.]